MTSPSQARRIDPAEAGRSLYKTDGYAWANQQADLIRAGRFSELDIENVAEEIESVGRSEKSGFVMALARVIQHLLKWDHQPDKRSASWWHSVNTRRVRAAKDLRDNPSFKGVLTEIMQDAFEIAVADAMADTHLSRDTFPAACPYSFIDVMERTLEPVVSAPRRPKSAR